MMNEWQWWFESPLTAIALAAVIFFALRSVYTWYTKQTRVVSLLEEISSKLDRISTEDKQSE